MQKRCNKCKVIKDGEEFYTKNRPLDLTPEDLSYYSSNCKACARVVQTIRRNSSKESSKGVDLYHKFKIRYKDFENMLENQQFRCAICQRHVSEFSRSFHVDHDHKTGKIRELLCGNCNTAIGKLQESVSVLQSAITYLNKHNPALADHNTNVLEIRFHKKVG